MFEPTTPLYSLTCGQFVELLRSERERMQPSKPELPKFLNPVQLSELIGWKLATVYQNHHNGLIPGARKVGGKLLFDSESILSWIQEKSIPTNEQKVQALQKKGGAR
jgi:predicted DNA-binding transcriptional regulator AlpA